MGSEYHAAGIDRPRRPGRPGPCWSLQTRQHGFQSVGEEVPVHKSPRYPCFALSPPSSSIQLKRTPSPARRSYSGRRQRAIVATYYSQLKARFVYFASHALPVMPLTLAITSSTALPHPNLTRRSACQWRTTTRRNKQSTPPQRTAIRGSGSQSQTLGTCLTPMHLAWLGKTCTHVDPKLAHKGRWTEAMRREASPPHTAAAAQMRMFEMHDEWRDSTVHDV